MDAIGADPSVVEAELIEAVYSDNITQFEKAQADVDRAGARLRFAHDWLQALQAGDE